jgi:hypothetical protein
MLYRRAMIIAFSTLFSSTAATMAAAEPVGEAVVIKTDVTGQGGPIVVNGPVHRDERISTSKSGLGQFVFKDGTKLAVGWGSSVVIDKFVFDDSETVKKLSIKAAKGTFRWISGNSKSSAYQILTPAGTIGVRGTAFDFHIGADGTTAIVLLNGAAQLCGAGGCRQLTKRCDCVVGTPNGRLSDVRPVDRAIVSSIGGMQSLPFLSGSQPLSGGFGNQGCGLSASNQDRPSGRDPTRAAPPSPSPRAPDSPPAQRAPDRPAPQADTPNTPDTPDTPDPPSKPGKPDKHEGKRHSHHHENNWNGKYGRHDGDHDGGRHEGRTYGRR